MSIPRFKHIAFYLFVKYSVFAVVLALLDNRFKSLVIDNADNNPSSLFWGTFQYSFEVVAFILLMVLILTAPIYFSFKIKKALYFWIAQITIFISEYFIYTQLASTSDLKNGLYNVLISVLLFPLFFFKHIRSHKSTLAAIDSAL
jgi:hypothetical protein